MEASESQSEPKVLAQEIAADLLATMEQFASIVDELKE
jgi:hypothetical protein